MDKKWISWLLLTAALLVTGCRHDSIPVDIPDAVKVQIDAFKKQPLLCSDASIKEFLFQEIKVYGFSEGTCTSEPSSGIYDAKGNLLCTLGGLDAFFAGHDPTTLNRQGPDVGRDYRSVAFYRTPQEKAEIQAAIKRTNESKHYANPVVTEVTPLKVFYPAENYHQNYFSLHPDQPYIRSVSLPKVEKLRKAMAGHLKNNTSLTMNE